MHSFTSNGQMYSSGKHSETLEISISLQQIGVGDNLLWVNISIRWQKTDCLCRYRKQRSMAMHKTFVIEENVTDK